MSVLYPRNSQGFPCDLKQGDMDSPTSKTNLGDCLTFKVPEPDLSGKQTSPVASLSLSQPTHSTRAFHLSQVHRRSSRRSPQRPMWAEHCLFSIRCSQMLQPLTEGPRPNHPKPMHYQQRPGDSKLLLRDSANLIHGSAAPRKEQAMTLC